MEDLRQHQDTNCKSGAREIVKEKTVFLLMAYRDIAFTLKFD